MLPAFARAFKQFEYHLIYIPVKVGSFFESAFLKYGIENAPLTRKGLRNKRIWLFLDMTTYINYCLPFYVYTKPGFNILYLRKRRPQEGEKSTFISTIENVHSPN